MRAHATDDPLVERDLERFSGVDEVSAHEAFQRLWSQAAPGLARYVGWVGVAPEDVEDVCQRTATALWRHRRRLRARSLRSLRAWLVKTARHEAAAVAREDGERRDAERRTLPPQEEPYLEAFAMAADQVRRVYEAADRVWLGDGGPEASVRAAAVQQVLCEGVPEEEAARMFGVDGATLAAWLHDPAIIARAMFSALCWSGDSLAESMARAEPGEGAPPLPSGWARLVLLRALNGLTDAQLVEAFAGTVDASGVASMLDRYRGELPFRSIACAILDALETRGLGPELSRTGLWRRIAFEYDARDLLPHRQIVERAGPPAAVAGVRVDSPTLNNWLSVGRLYAQLAAALREAE